GPASRAARPPRLPDPHRHAPHLRTTDRPEARARESPALARAAGGFGAREPQPRDANSGAYRTSPAPDRSPPATNSQAWDARPPPYPSDSPNAQAGRNPNPE